MHNLLLVFLFVKILRNQETIQKNKNRNKKNTLNDIFVRIMWRLSSTYFRKKEQQFPRLIQTRCSLKVKIFSSEKTISSREFQGNSESFNCADPCCIFVLFFTTNVFFKLLFKAVILPVIHIYCCVF